MGRADKTTVTATLSSTASCRERALKSISRLPPFSPVLNKLIASLADDNVSFGDLAALVEKDTVLAGNVLRLVNSALYARRGTVNSVRHAVSILGLAKLRNAAMTWSVARMWSSHKYPQGWSASHFNLHSVAAAVLSDLLAIETKVEYAEGAFAAGLLQNVGMLLEVTGLPDEFAEVRKLYLDGRGSWVDCERNLLGLDHAELSAETLKQWNLPAPIVAAVRAHHTPADPMTLACMVQTADLAVEVLGVPVQEWHKPIDSSAEELLAAIGLADQAESILLNFRAEYEALREFF